MASLLRILLVAFALLTSGAVQFAAAAGNDPCCAEAGGAGDEHHGSDAPCDDCPPGLACACCPSRGAVEGAAVVIAPPQPSGVAVHLVVAEPEAGPPPGGVFQPPRA